MPVPGGITLISGPYGRGRNRNRNSVYERSLYERSVRIAPSTRCSSSSIVFAAAT